MILPFASGKGGVGKTLTAVHTAIALAALGKTVILLDADTGGSNAHTILDIRNTNPGMGSLIYREERRVEELILESRIPRLFLIPGDGRFTGTTNPPVWLRRKLAKELPELVCDFLIIDLGAGVANFTLDMFLLSNRPILVTTPEIPALLNAYNFVKHALIRLFQLRTRARSEEGRLVASFHARTLDSHLALESLIRRIHSLNPEAAARIKEDLGNFQPQAVLNMGTDQQDLKLGNNLKQTALKHLGLNLDYLAFIPWHNEMRALVNTRRLVFDEEQNSAVKIAYERLARKLLEFEGSVLRPLIIPTEEELLDQLLDDD